MVKRVKTSDQCDIWSKQSQHLLRALSLHLSQAPDTVSFNISSCQQHVSECLKLLTTSSSPPKNDDLGGESPFKEPTPPSLIHVYTDGSCQGNPGPGGYGFVFVRPDTDTPLYSNGGHLKQTTNNRAELQAVLAALRYACDMQSRMSLVLYSDSQYVVKIAQDKWKCKGNFDLWTHFHKLTRACKENSVKVTFTWIRGHQGQRWNEHVDQLARKMCTL